MRSKRVLPAVAGAIVALCTGVAAADMMHPVLGAKLSGMGEHGIVNLQSEMTKGKLCWTFDVMAKGLTGASIRDAAGMKVAALGTAYTAKGCAMVSKKALGLIESSPAKYHVWVDTKGHPGDLRGTLFAGMAHM